MKLKTGDLKEFGGQQCLVFADKVLRQSFFSEVYWFTLIKDFICI